MGSVAMPDAGVVLPEADVSHVVKFVFHVPVAAVVFEQSLGSSTAIELQARDPANGFFGEKLSSKISSLPLDFENLLGAWKITSRGISRKNDDLSLIDSTMAFVDGAYANKIWSKTRIIECVLNFFFNTGLVIFYDENVVSAFFLLMRPSPFAYGGRRL
jgi:hypothetical protein